MNARRLVGCGLIDATTMRVTLSDDSIWLFSVGQGANGTADPGQIDRWLAAIAGVDPREYALRRAGSPSVLDCR
jgi:hypothetical protein